MLDDPLASICNDGLPSAAESGIDCGGGCQPCGMGQACRAYTDCESRACTDGTCQFPTCDDKVKNGAEADTDCGGRCDACPPGKDCRTAQDCAEGVCLDAFCQVPTCADEVKNGDETGADCGGSCGPCALGEGCTVNADCESTHCSEGVCVSPRCTDGIPNDLETDVDCGGSECGPCPATEHCKVGTDCMSLICASKACTSYSCDDKVLNGEESALDCGGSSCDGCANLEHCNGAVDCASGVCQTGVCVPAMPTGAMLSRLDWSAKASNTYPDDTPDQVLDDIPGRWTTNANQYPGMWFEVDMSKLQAFFAVQLICEEAVTDIPAKFDLYFSSDGEYDKPVRSGLFGATSLEIRFDTAQLARYVKFVITQPKTKWWSIDEIKVLE